MHPLSTSSSTLPPLLCPIAPQWDGNHYPPTSCPPMNSPNVLTNPVCHTQTFNPETVSPPPPQFILFSPTSHGTCWVPWRLPPTNTTHHPQTRPPTHFGKSTHPNVALQRPGQARLWMGAGAIVAFAPISGSDLWFYIGQCLLG